jgi:hypothetical protein
MMRRYAAVTDSDTPSPLLRRYPGHEPVLTRRRGNRAWQRSLKGLMAPSLLMWQVRHEVANAQLIALMSSTIWLLCQSGATVAVG